MGQTSAWMLTCGILCLLPMGCFFFGYWLRGSGIRIQSPIRRTVDKENYIPDKQPAPAVLRKESNIGYGVRPPKG